MKRSISLILAALMMAALIPFASAASPEASQAADALHELGLFNGVGTNADGTPIYELDRTPTRHEAITMLVRLLGKEADAQLSSASTPFTDVADWARPYVSYAMANRLTTGTSATTFGGEQPIKATEYITFVLRALGYSSGSDFEWDKAWVLSDKIGLTDGRYNENTTEFTRGDVAIISNKALSTNLNMSSTTLYDYIKDSLGTPSTGTAKEYSKDEVALLAQTLQSIALNTERMKASFLGDYDAVFGYVPKIRNDIAVALQICNSHSDDVSKTIALKLKANDATLQQISFLQLQGGEGSKEACANAIGKLEGAEQLLELTNKLPVAK